MTRRNCANALAICMICASVGAWAEKPNSEISTNYELSSQEGPDWAGLKSDTAYFIGYQVVTIGILYAMPESVSGWSEESKKEYSAQRWLDNADSPHWDEDDFYLNYVLHPYWGASYFVRARERGFDRRSSFWYSTFLSTLYEFGVEALFEQPSIQDLLVTPIAGAFLGEYFMRVRTNINTRLANGAPIRWRDRWALALTDPLGAMNERVGRMFGRQANLSVKAFAAKSIQGNAWEPGTLESLNAPESNTVGVTLELRF